MSALELQAVSKTRGRGPHAVAALRDVSLTIAPGEVVLLDGPSGSGKTTLLAIAAGLLRADQGDVVLAGMRLDGTPPALVRAHRSRTVGFVFQRASLMPGLTARENVLLMATLAGRPRREAERETDRLLEEVGIAHRADHRPAELSGGEEQRVAVARALVHRPALILADEPTANLDGATGLLVAEQLRDLAAERGAGVLIATHDPRLAPVATRRLHLVDGCLAAEPHDDLLRFRDQGRVIQRERRSG
jgi:putative ABC transport system ATP-binding protein